MVKKKDPPKQGAKPAEGAKPKTTKSTRKKAPKKPPKVQELEAPIQLFMPGENGSRRDDKIPSRFVRLRAQQNKDIELIWLYCPQCQSLQYTATVSLAGRTHVVCNTPVTEKSLRLYAALEYAMTRHNFDLANKLSAEYRDRLDEMDTIYNLAYVSSTKTAMIEFQKKIVEAYKIRKQLESLELSEQKLDAIFQSKELDNWVAQALKEKFIKDSYGFLHSPFFLFPLTHFLAN